MEVGYRVEVGHRAGEPSLLSEVIGLPCELSSWTPDSLGQELSDHEAGASATSLLVTERTAAGAPCLCHVWHSGESTVLSGGPPG